MSPGIEEIAEALYKATWDGTDEEYLEFWGNSSKAVENRGSLGYPSWGACGT